METKRILFISYDGMTDPLGQSQVIPYLSNLTRFGYTFTILSCDKPDKYKANEQYVRQLIQSFPIEWVSVPYHKNPPVLSSLYDFYTLRRTALKLHREKPFDMVHTRPGLPTLVALHLKRKYGVKFLNDVRGFWPDERVDGGMWNLKNPLFRMIYRFFKKHEAECLNEADHVVCLTYAAREEMHRWKNIRNQPLPIEVIPCSADLDLFNPAAVDPALKKHFREELQLKETDCIISYLGSIGGWYLTDEMMRFCKLLSQRIAAAKFLFIAPDHGHSAIRSAADKAGLPSEKLIIRQGRRHEVPVLLSFSTYSLFFIKPCFSKISSSPTKHGEIMAMGIPVITNTGVGDVDSIVKNYNAGFLVDGFTDESYDEVIREIGEGKKFDPLAIRNGARDFYALETAVERYRKVYDGILRK